MASFIPDSPIQAILFCEFHHEYGPKISFQVPENYMKKEHFYILRDYIITKKEYQKKLITVNALNYKIIGYPVNIDDLKYKRNALIFNMCFVCDADKRTIQYEPIVKKLAEYLTTLELESCFLSNEHSKQKLVTMMQCILDSLNKDGMCTIPIEGSNNIHLKVIKKLKDPVKVEDYLVPVLLVTRKTILITHPDLTTLQVIPHIDGFKHVGRIAAEAEVEISMVKSCIENLAYYGVVCLIGIFQYSNMYTTLPELHKLAYNVNMQKKCLKYVAKRCDKLPTFKDVFMMYCGLTPGTTVKDLCARYYPNSLGIDERKLIQFGLIYSLIRRIHKYPVLLPSDSNDSTAQESPLKYFTGLCSYDEICTKTGLSFKELDEYIEGDPAVIVCMK